MTSGAPLHRWLPAAPPTGEPPNPGWLVIGLAAVGLWAVMRRAGEAGRGAPRDSREGDVRAPWRALLAVTAVAAILALGPSLRWGGVDLGVPLPGALLGETLRAPARWLAVVHVGVGVLASAGLARGIAGARGIFGGRGASGEGGAVAGTVGVGVGAGGVGVGVAIGLGAVALALGELPRPEVAPVGSVAPESVHARLVGGTGPLYESVGGRDGGGRDAGGRDGGGRDPGLDAGGRDTAPRACGSAERKLHAALEHGRPVVGGQYARSFPAVAAVNRLAGSWPSPVALTFFQLTGVTTTLEHPPLRAPADGLAACEIVDGHRLCAIPAADRDPLPDLAEVSPSSSPSSPGSPVLGFRWPAPLPIGEVTLTCDGAAEVTQAGVWNGLALVRQGGEAPPTDVYFAHPCPGAAAASVPGGEALGRAGGG